MNEAHRQHRRDPILWLYLCAQIGITALFVPFQLLAWIFTLAANGVRRLGTLLLRDLLWAVLLAKRRRFKMPLWQPHDFAHLGIGPPCEHCGTHVPPGRHLSRCDFLRTPVRRS